VSEVRPVAPGWEHPRDPATGHHMPLHSRRDLRHALEWNASEDEQIQIDPADYMPPIPDGAPVGYVLYETVSEGTPASPVFPSLQELADWCSANWDDGRFTAEEWLDGFDERLMADG
jgi:hypothetical protein